jgi:glycine cleavage system H protein
MQIEKIPERDLYYTNDHDWIDFQGKVAYVGVCRFKLTGFKEVQQLIVKEPLGFKTKGQIIATIRYNDYIVDARMPVDGKVVQLNDLLLTGDYSILAQQPEHNGWIALIIPAEPKDRDELLSPEQYKAAKTFK